MADSSYDPKNVRKNQNNSEDLFNAVLARAMKRIVSLIVTRKKKVNADDISN